MSIIEKLEKLPVYLDREGECAVLHEYIVAIIEEYKKQNKVSYDPYYFIKVIGETDWYECTKTQYLRAKNLPEYDYKMTEIYDDELNPLYGFDIYKQAKNNLLSDETVKDAAIGKLVREKMQSGNDVPVSRCTITRIEFDEAMEADNAKSETTKA